MSVLLGLKTKTIIHSVTIRHADWFYKSHMRVVLFIYTFNLLVLMTEGNFYDS